MRTSTAYFAGVGTVVAAIAIGAGGGFTIARIMNPHDAKQEVSQADRRTGGEQAKLPTASSQPPVLPRDMSQAPTKPVTVAPAPQPQQPQPGQSDLVAATPPEPAAAPDRTQQASSPAPGTQTAAREPSATSEIRNANARAREADVRRATAEKRRAERRQRWAERRRMRQDD
ncbi:hypothetical protein J6500_31605, partial [Bradyrhizobium sp. WSM 1704]|uniref:hypothetical protein n=1 Tax=Bradyrhizobium semiaridum TaxID=2821404 RepID=UPI001CE2613C